MSKNTPILMMALTFLGGGVYRLINGTWPKNWWIIVLVVLGTTAITSILDGIQSVFGATLEIKEQIEEVKEKIEQLEETVADLDTKLPRSTKSILDEY